MSDGDDELIAECRRVQATLRQHEEAIQVLARRREEIVMALLPQRTVTQVALLVGMSNVRVEGIQHRVRVREWEELAARGDQQ